MNQIFIDHANATPCDPRVVEAMLPFFTERFGNPSSHIIATGHDAVTALDAARCEVAAFVGAKPEEIVFTSGATEANNLAIKGFCLANARRGRHVVTSDVEHFSVINPLNTLQRDHGFEITVLPVDASGQVSASMLAKALRPDTILVSVQHANSEIGTIQRLGELVAAVKGFDGAIAFHADGTAACGYMPVDFTALGVDLYTVSAHSLYGPKGAGALVARNGVTLKAQSEGGFQERGLRSGTENVPAIIGFAKACTLAKDELPARAAHLAALRDRLRDGLVGAVDFLHVTGHETERLPHNFSFWVEYAEGESLLLMLNYMGVQVSSGSACSSNLRAKDEHDLVASTVLKAIGVPDDICTGSLTFSFGMGNTVADVDQVLSVFPGIVQRIWQMSPFYLDKIKGHTPKLTKHED